MNSTVSIVIPVYNGAEYLREARDGAGRGARDGYPGHLDQMRVPEEIVEPGLGLLVERDNEEGLSGEMLAMTEHSYSESTLRERALARFSFGVVAQQLVCLYEAVGGRHGA